MAVSGRKAKPQFSSTFSCGSGEDYDIFCQPCDRADITLPAAGFCIECEEHLCESCCNHHKRAKLSMHHTLLDKQNMPQTLQVPSQYVDANPAGPSDDLTTACTKHKKEMIKFYCNYHKTLLCSLCVTLDHTGTSCRVDYIPDISKNNLDSKEYTKSLHTMGTVIQKYQKIIEDLKKKTTASNHSLSDVLQEIKKFRQEINQRLDELEKEANDMAKACQQENNQRLKTAETSVDDVTKSLNASSDYIKQLNDSKQADKLFVELKHVDQLIKDNEKRMSLLASPKDVVEYHFKPNPVSCLLKEKSLGTLISFSQHNDICVKTSKDYGRCTITEIILLTPSKLLLTDNSNMSIKMVDLNKNSITNQLQLDTIPFKMTRVTSDQFAFTTFKTIQFISASSNKLSLKHKLKVDGNCYGISCYQEKLVVTFITPGKLQILNLKGKVLTTVTTDSIGEEIFSCPYHITSNSHFIYVSDEVKQAVISLNWEGELTGSYGGMGFPRGLAMLEDGSILVCDMFNDNIHEISGDLTKGKVVLKDVENPWAICWCGTNRKLYISQDRGYEQNGNSIEVFKMS